MKTSTTDQYRGHLKLNKFWDKQRSSWHWKRLVINSQLSIAIAPKGEYITLVWYERSVSKPTCYMTDDDFEAEALGKVEYFLSVDAIVAMTKLSILIAAPWEEFSVAFFDDLCISIEARVASMWLLVVLHFLFYNFKR